jgi:prophage regulatory protein
MDSYQTMNQNSILRLPRVKNLTGLGRSTIYLKVGDGSFPKPVKLSSRAIGWRAEDVDAWIASRQSTGGAA